MTDDLMTGDSDLLASPHTSVLHSVDTQPWDAQLFDAKGNFQKTGRPGVRNEPTYFIPLHLILETSTTFSTIGMRC